MKTSKFFLVILSVVLIFITLGCSGNTGKIFVVSIEDDGIACDLNSWSSTGNGPSCANCSIINNTTNFSATDRKSCVCSSGYIWNTSTGTCVVPTVAACDGTHWSTTGYETCNACNCTHCTGTSTNNKKGCSCESGYIWNVNNCVTPVACDSSHWSSTGYESCNACNCTHCSGASSINRKSCVCAPGGMFGV